MKKKYTKEIPLERSGELKDDPRFGVHQLKEYIEMLQAPEKLRNAFNTLIRSQAVSADDGKFNQAYQDAIERRYYVLDKLDKL